MAGAILSEGAAERALLRPPQSGTFAPPSASSWPQSVALELDQVPLVFSAKSSSTPSGRGSIPCSSAN